MAPAAQLLYHDPQAVPAAVTLPPQGACLGRGVFCIVRTNDAMVARQFCRILYRDGAWQVEDLGSSGGTWVNEQRLTGTQVLQHGDVIRSGSLQVRFVLNPTTL